MSGISLQAAPGCEGVFILKFDCGENRFNPTSIAKLNAMLDELEAKDGPAALVTVGAGKFFSNGLDLGHVANVQSPLQVHEFLTTFEKLLARILTLPVPTVAAINGHAFAGGCMLAMAHDYRVMRTGRGFICLNEVELGMGLRPGMNALLQCKMTANVFRDAVFTAKRFSAEEAFKNHIVDAAVPEDEVLTSAVGIAKALAKNRGEALGTLKAEAYKREVRVLSYLDGPPSHPSKL